MADLAVVEGRAAFERGAWADAYAGLAAADATSPLEGADLERLAMAAHLVGNDSAAIDVLIRLHRDAAGRGDVAAAARSAFWLSMLLARNGEHAQAGGWLARGQRIVHEHDYDGVERGYLLIPVGLGQLEAGDPAGAAATFVAAAAIGDRFSDPDLATLGRLGQGDARIALGDRGTGLALLDEVMVGITAGEVSPVIVGIAYCSVIETCHGLFDLRRAQEWTAALSRWCAAQPDLVPYRGQCLLYRAELKQFHGAWQEAIDEAREATERRAQPADEPLAAAAYYRQAELLRLRGEFADAEAAYRQASRHGQRPEPGLALLRLAEGRLDQAATSIRRALSEEHPPAVRARVLEAAVDILLAGGQTSEARAAADELGSIARDSGAPLLDAMAARADGSVALAEHDPREALRTLRAAWAAWQALDAPYLAARTRVLVAAACRDVGDEDAATLELEAARAAFERLGARVDLEAIDRRPGGQPAANGLTDRELEVLRLVAAGRTNRAIGEALVISHKTVARHIANIFIKIDVSSRAAATAWAYRHGLAGPAPDGHAEPPSNGPA
jgi:DNA-binding NarL/FixJ family response regulator